MPRSIRPVGHEDRLSLIEHLDELRTRLVVCLVGFMVAFSVAVWQNQALLDVVNRPLERTTAATGKHASGPLEETAQSQVRLRKAFEDGAAAFRQLADAPSLTGTDRAALRAAISSYAAAARALPKKVPGRQPVTLGVTEPFTTTLNVSLWFAVMFSLPLFLYQAYAFVVPAFRPEERKVVRPLMLLVPVLFACGVAFGYYVVVPPAVKFLQTFNSSSYDVLVQAKPYYSFVILALISMGVLFQIPIAILALTRAGVVSVRQLRKNRRYAIVVIAVLAMLLPTLDPVTMLLEMLPLLVLYELSILLASWLERVGARGKRADALAASSDPDESADAV
jgi:sec-independent protein translocase protein TatC